MTAHQVIVAERKDLSSITVVCLSEKCGARTSFDIARPRDPMEKGAGRVPESCPSCDEPFGHNAVSALRALASFHRSAAEAEASKQVAFQFEIRDEVGHASE
jgi:hypothetical protein